MQKLNVFFYSLLIIILSLFLSPVQIKANVIAQQTSGYENQFNSWQAIQELGNNLSGPLGSFTFRVSTSKSDSEMFDFTGINTRIYDKSVGVTNALVARSCYKSWESGPTMGLFFNTVGVPAGFKDVTVDFTSCNNYTFIPGHRYAILITNANAAISNGKKIQFRAAAYGNTSTDYFLGGGLRYSYDNAGCNVAWYAWNSPVNSYGCNVLTNPNDDLYFILSDTAPTPPPTPTPSPTPIPTKTPVIFIPGIGGSEFKSDATFISNIKDCGTSSISFPYGENTIVWVNELQAAASACDDYFDILKLKTDGITPEYPHIVLNNTLYQGAYGNTIKFFTDNDYHLGQDLFVFPYDWRTDITLTAPLLNSKIEEIKTQTGSPKVDIVAHSMGGLIARNYINDSTRAQNVRKLITLGTPYLGAVDTLKKLQYGGCLAYELGPLCLSINPSEMKDVIQNMPGAYELTPSQKYYDFYDGSDNNHPFPFVDNRDIDNNRITGFLNYQQLKTTLANLSYNTGLFNPAETFHNLDNNLNNINGVDVSIIAGSGQATTGQIIEDYHFNFGGIKIPKTDIKKVNGDETVPLLSASLIDSYKNLYLADPDKVYYTNQQHRSLVFDGPAMNLVKNILNNDSSLPERISKTPYHFEGTGLSSHSPVLIHAYDQNNNHTGPLPNGDYETNIPGSTYEVLGDAKFIWLPDNGIYTVKFEATDQGSFDFKIRDYKDDINDKTILYKSVSLTKSTKAETVFDTNSIEPPTLQLDLNGDGTTDSQINSSTTLIDNANYDNTPPIITINSPLKDGVLILNQSATADFQCSDENSGIDKCQGTVNNGANIDTSSVGTKEFKVFAEDKAGNTSLQTITYKVQYSNGPCLDNSGHIILQPINNEGTSIFKQGSTIPAKFRVCDNNGLSIGSNDVINNFNLVKTIFGTTIDEINEPIDSTNPESNFRWDVTKQQWIFNMNTKNLFAGKTYFYKIGLNDGTDIDFSFGLK